MEAAKAARDSLCEDGDVVLICNDGKELRAHTALLRLVSPVLRGAVDTLPPGSSSAGIPVEEEADTWEHALCLLYHIGECPDMDLASAERLLRLSHKYNIKGVEVQCMRFVMAHELTFDHSVDTAGWPDVQGMNLKGNCVLRWLALADRLGNAALLAKCITCIQETLSRPHYNEWGQEDRIQPLPPGTMAPRASVLQLMCTPEFIALLKPTTNAQVMGALTNALGGLSFHYSSGIGCT